MLTLGRSWSEKNAPKFSSKFLNERVNEYAKLTIFELHAHDNKSKYSSNPKNIFNSAKKKYEKRYPKQFSTTATTVFLSKVPNRKKISNEHSSLCEVEVSLNEILNSINSDKNNKSPGNDDLTSEFFTHFQMN